MTTTNVGILAAAVLATAILPGPIPSGTIPDELKERYCGTYISGDSGKIRADIRTKTKEEKVSIRWKYSALKDFSSPDNRVTQDVAVGYWPTTAEVVDGTHVLISGKDVFGKTKIELWELTVPDMTSEKPKTGVSKVTVLYDRDLPGLDLVRVMFANVGKPGTALVQSNDTNELYEVDWNQTPATITLLMTPSTGTTATHVPGLANVFDEYWRGDHSVHGYIYVFGRRGKPSNPTYGTEPALLLTDGDRNGTIDSSALVGVADGTWSNMGLSDDSLYVSRLGY